MPLRLNQKLSDLVNLLIFDRSFRWLAIFINSIDFKICAHSSAHLKHG